MYKTIKDILNSDLRFEEDLIEIKNRLIEIDESTKDLELYEIEILWQWFSASRCAGFLVVCEDSLKSFVQWIGETGED